MPLSNEEIKARLLAETEAMLDDLLATRQPNESLDDIEALASEAGHRFGERLTASLAGEYGQPSPEKLKCPGCGQVLLYKGQKDKRLVTTSGEITIRRAYYYCKNCRQGYFPPG